MAIKAKKLNASKLPGRTELYEVGSSCELPVEEKQKDGSLDWVILIYCVEKGNIGYFPKEYRPIDVEKTGAKVIDITAVMLDCGEKCVRWHLYDIKDTLAGENTIVKLYDQWSFGLRYLQKNILDGVTGYRVIPDLGVITRCYDERRMERLRDDYDEYCERLLAALKDGKLEQCALEACQKFEEIRAKWIRVKGEHYKFGVKDSAEFRRFLIKEVYGVSDERDVEKLYVGYVRKVNLDKHNTLFGFIEHSPNNIFFHEFDNPDMNRSYVGKKVSYKIVRNGNQERAINVRLVES